MAHILVIDDEELVMTVLRKVLISGKYDVTATKDCTEGVELLKQQDFDLLVCDLKMTPLDGMQLLRIARASKPNLPVLMMTGYATVATAVEALKLGAFDYITKPFKIDELLNAVKRALDYGRTLSGGGGTRELTEELFGLPGIIAVNESTKAVCATIKRIATTDVPILMVGESGSGKATIAKAVHEQSHRKDGPFVRANCSGILEATFDEQMFGKSGAAGEKGLLPGAQKGTLFLEDLELMSHGVQVKMERLLQEKKFSGPDGKGDVPLDVRFMAATTANLDQVLLDGAFSKSLFYRLKGIQIDVKPLRERQEDVIPLATYLLQKELGGGRKLPLFAPDAREVLMKYKWPGNATELETAMKYVIRIAGNEQAITKAALPADIAASVATSKTEAEADTHRGERLKEFLQRKLGGMEAVSS